MRRIVSITSAIGGILMMALFANAGPLVIAHRGYSAVAPENTLAAVKRAVALNPQPAYVEIDLHRSSDGALIVSHDSNTLRATGQAKMIRETPFPALRKLSAGYAEKFGDQFKNEQLPTLEEVLDIVKDTPVGIMIECKQLLLEDQVVDLLKKRGELQKHVIASFDELTIYRAKKLEPAARTLYLASGINPDAVWRARDLKAEIIGFNGSEKPENIGQAQKAGFKVWVWTIDKPDDVSMWLQAKVDGIITNQPEQALKIINK